MQGGRGVDRGKNMEETLKGHKEMAWKSKLKTKPDTTRQHKMTIILNHDTKDSSFLKKIIKLERRESAA